jgi:glucosylceramidase
MIWVIMGIAAFVLLMIVAGGNEQRVKNRGKDQKAPPLVVPSQQPKDRCPPADAEQCEIPSDIFCDPGMNSGDIEVVVTSPDKQWAEQPAIRFRAPSDVPLSRGETISIDTTKSYQSILGFGGAFSDAACYNFFMMPEQKRAQLFHTLFHPSEMGLNVHRACIGSSDYATKMYSYDEGEPDPELKRFSIDHDRQWNLPIMREAVRINPDMFIFGSAWSPPGWMKSNKSMLGGNMRRQWMQPYAQYIVRFVQEYAKEGVTVQAVTVNNEVDTDQDGRMPACLWPQEYEVDFIRWHLGPAFAAAGLKTNIWMLDHNYNLWGRAIASFEEQDVLKYCTSVAWHGYIGNPAAVGRVREAFPQVDHYWTEGGPDITDPTYRTDWAKWGRSFTTSMRNWCRSITVWNLALDENGRPNIGPFPCGGLVTILSDSKAVMYSGQYWALGQFSKFVKRSALRVESTGDFAGLDHIAFLNPDGQRVLVVTNSGDTVRHITLEVAGDLADVAVEADSVTTLVW